MLRSFSQLENTMAERPDNKAMVAPDSGAVWTYSDFLKNIRQASAVLDARLKEFPLDRPVAVCLLNGFDFLACFFGLARLGRPVMPLNPSLTPDVYRSQLGDGNVCAVIVNQASPQAVFTAAAALDILSLDVTLGDDGGILFPKLGNASFAECGTKSDSESVSLLLQTSGTTGKPKWVPLTQRNLMASAEHISNTYKLTPEDISLLVMPLFHVHGFIGVALSTLFSGGSLIVPPKFSASRFWDWVKIFKPSWYSAVPTIHQILLSRDEIRQAPRGVFRFIRSCSSPLAPAVMAKMEEVFAAPVLEAYGMTEAAHQMASNPLPPGKRFAGSVGVAAGPEVAVFDENGNSLPTGQQGEIVIRGENVMKGYLDNQEANRKAFVNGWFRTGDMGILDEHGYLKLVARLKEMINRGGEKIAPAQIDAAILEMPGVNQAVAFGVPDALYGEIVNVVIITSGNLTEENVLEYCRAKLPPFMVPAKVIIRDSIPTGATGKVSRVQLPQLLGIS